MPIRFLPLLALAAQDPARLTRARVIAAILAVAIAALLALIILLCLRWAAARIAKARDAASPSDRLTHASPWTESAKRVHVYTTGLTGQGGAGPRLITDSPHTPTTPDQFDVFDPDDTASSLDETDGFDDPDDTDAFDFNPDDDDDNPPDPDDERPPTA